jgi:hypothetical protein
LRQHFGRLPQKARLTALDPVYSSGRAAQGRRFDNEDCSRELKCFGEPTIGLEPMTADYESQGLIDPDSA